MSLDTSASIETMMLATVTPLPEGGGGSMRATLPLANLDHVRRFAHYIIVPTIGCAELRILEATFERSWVVAADQYAKTLGGWYNDIDTLVRDIQSVKNVNVFTTFNPVTNDLLARTNNTIRKNKATTTDADIVCIRWLFLDFDPDRPADVSATNEELALAIGVRDRFLDEHPEIRASAIWGCSGNGTFVLVRLPDMPNDDATNTLVKRAMAFVGSAYGTDKVKLDSKTSNPARIIGLIGMKKCKGTSVNKRPWRLSSLDSPEGHEPMPLDLLAWLQRNVHGPAATDEGRPVTVNHRAEGGHASYLKANGPLTVLKRARKWLDHCDPSNMGQNGSKSLLWAASVGPAFNLDPGDCYQLLSTDYNVPGRCNPIWSLPEIQHVVDSIYERESRRGWLLDSNRGQPAIVNEEMNSDIAESGSIFSRAITLFNYEGAWPGATGNSGGLSTEEFARYNELYDGMASDDEINNFVESC
jgi:hypothetical protein